MTENRQENPEEVVLHIVQLYCMEKHQFLKISLVVNWKVIYSFGVYFLGEKNNHAEWFLWARATVAQRAHQKHGCTVVTSVNTWCQIYTTNGSSVNYLTAVVIKPHLH